MIATSMIKNHINNVVSRIEQFYERYKPNKIWFFYSGGKDSSAVLVALSELAKKRPDILERIIVLYTAVTGNTHYLNRKQTYENVKRFLPDHYSNFVQILPKSREYVKAMLSTAKPPCFVELNTVSWSYQKPYLDTIIQVGFPTMVSNRAGGVRWCCAEFKEKWWSILPHENGKRCIIVGVKAYDSAVRKKRWEPAIKSGTFELQFKSGRVVEHALSPIADFRHEDVWLVLRHYNVELPSYQYGDSLNCIVCPFKRRKDIEAMLPILHEKQLRMVAKAFCTSFAKGMRGKMVVDQYEQWRPFIERYLECRPPIETRNSNVKSLLSFLTPSDRAC